MWKSWQRGQNPWSLKTHVAGFLTCLLVAVLIVATTYFLGDGSSTDSAPSNHLLAARILGLIVGGGAIIGLARLAFNWARGHPYRPPNLQDLTWVHLAVFVLCSLAVYGLFAVLKTPS